MNIDFLSFIIPVLVDVFNSIKDTIKLYFNPFLCSLVVSFIKYPVEFKETKECINCRYFKHNLALSLFFAIITYHFTVSRGYDPDLAIVLWGSAAILAEELYDLLKMLPKKVIDLYIKKYFKND